MKSETTKMPGLNAPAFFCSAFSLVSLAVALSFVVSGVAMAQSAPAPQPVFTAAPTSAPPPISSTPVPGELELVKLIWTTMVAVDQGNRSGNYSVLRDLSASGFQINNDPAQLTQIFAGIRNTRLDLANTLLVAPVYTGGPVLIAPDVFRVKGYFALRPTAIAFDLQFQWQQGRWKMFGVSLAPQPLSTQLPVSPGVRQAAPPPAPPRRPTP